MFALVGCGNSVTDYGSGVTDNDFQEYCVESFQALTAFSDEELAQAYMTYASSEENAVLAPMFLNWMEIKGEVGEFVAFSDMDVAKSGKTITATLTCDYTNRDVKLIAVFSSRNFALQSVNIERVYSKSEIMGKAGMNTLMGIGIVFFMLIVMSLIISCFKFISQAQNKTNKKETVSEAPVVATAPAVSAQDDLELVAVIAAAIAASTGASTDSFVVRSIKRRF